MSFDLAVIVASSRPKEKAKAVA